MCTFTNCINQKLVCISERVNIPFRWLERELFQYKYKRGELISINNAIGIKGGFSELEFLDFLLTRERRPSQWRFMDDVFDPFAPFFCLSVDAGHWQETVYRDPREFELSPGAVSLIGPDMSCTIRTVDMADLRGVLL